MFRFNLEDAISFGKPLLIENIEEEVDPLMDPILEKAIVKQGKGWKIALADKELDYTETFKLFMTSRLPNPHYTPELSAKVTVIDFTVTMKGLEDQLLGRVVATVENDRIIVENMAGNFVTQIQILIAGVFHKSEVLDLAVHLYNLARAGVLGAAYQSLQIPLAEGGDGLGSAHFFSNKGWNS